MAGADRHGRGGRRTAPRSAVRSLDRRGPVPGRPRVLIRWPQGFERTVTFALDEAPATITQRGPGIRHGARAVRYNPDSDGLAA